MRHLISLADLTDEELCLLVDRGRHYANSVIPEPCLAGRVVGTYFTQTSTRTRSAFSVAALRLGAGLLTYQRGDLQTNTGETLADTGTVLGGMLDALVVRTSGGRAELDSLAAGTRMAVINAMAKEEHPTQALTDLATMGNQLGKVDGLRVLYLGEGNNSAAALALALSRFAGVELHLRTPPGYGLVDDVLATAKDIATAHGSLVDERDNMVDLPGDVDVIYTTRWQTTGTSKPTADWREIFQPFQVTERLWRNSPNAVFMHDLPAHRGEEVTAAVLDGPHSIAFEQARQKLHSAMAVLEWCLVTSTAGTDRMVAP